MTVINLNKTRKTKAKAGAKAQAVANAVKFGRTKGEKLADEMQAEKVRREWDGKRRE
jgi:Domain of unknown function (DUF4169)